MNQSRTKQKIEEIHRTIAHLFARKGFHATSMRAIAQALEMQPASLYHYFKSKEEMLFVLMNESMDEAMEKLKKVCNTDSPPEQKLKDMLGFYARFFAGDQEREILLVNEIESLGDAYRKILTDKQRRYIHLIRSVFQELAEADLLKEVDSTVATFAFFGMVHYTIRWYDEEGPVDVTTLSDNFVEIFTRGILK
ncbi:MAG: TetR/AcrR family transcriptional regulator [Deltaproteobacteria bacterium]|jgi:AcrR family transcriptional regulator|nr:TetR/AcrR family transcriptional regulator [Deltaproteobacteria bacterium]